eukprot:3614346-Amphidinium_carterae.1
MVTSPDLVSIYASKWPFEDINLSWVSSALLEEAAFSDHLEQLKKILRSLPTGRLKRRPAARERWD